MVNNLFPFLSLKGLKPTLPQMQNKELIWNAPTFKSLRTFWTMVFAAVCLHVLL